MSLQVCLDCTTAYAVGVPLCPHCGSERRAEQGSAQALGIHGSLPVQPEEADMPKITRLGGASIAGHEPDAETTQEGGEDLSAGSSSVTSTEKPPVKPEPSGSKTPSRARKTANHSGRGQTADSTAASADGDPAVDTSETGSAEA